MKYRLETAPNSKYHFLFACFIYKYLLFVRSQNELSSGLSSITGSKEAHLRAVPLRNVNH